MPDRKKTQAAEAQPERPLTGLSDAALEAARPPRFSEELEGLIAAFQERTVRLRDVLEVTQNRGYMVLLILLSFPFCTPIPVPGVSTPFGLVTALIGLRLAFGQKLWLPGRVLDIQLPPKFFSRFVAATRRPVRGIEVLLKPRLGQLLNWPLARHGIGAMILLSGALLMLPLPIPFSNGLPALTVLLLALAMLEEDGWCVIAGGVMFLLTLAFFAVLFWGGAEVIEHIRKLVALNQSLFAVPV